MNLQYEIKNYLDKTGRLAMFPSKKKKQKIVLFFLASKFNLNQTYTEEEVNALLNEWHTYNDACTLRRELYNNHFIGRTLDGASYYKEVHQPILADFDIDDSFEPFDLFNSFKFLLSQYRLIRLTRKHKDKLYQLESSNPYYISLTQDHPITPEECIADLEATPENFPVKQKFYFGIFKDDQMIAVMDYLVGYDYEHTKKIQTVWIGFFMVHGNYKRQGIGKHIINSFIQAAKENGIDKIQLACIEGNKEGHSFWSQLGFREIAKTITTLSNKETRSVTVMNYSL
jgi:GNAT superfamily N-acetyltransferase